MDNFPFADYSGVIALGHRRPPSPGLASLGYNADQLCKGPRNHQCDVILLFASAAELLDRPNHRLMYQAVVL